MRGCSVVSIVRICVGLMVLCPAASWPCHVAGNLVPDCGFANGTEFANWVGSTGTFTHEPAQGSSEIGSAQGVAEDLTGAFGVFIERCVNVAIPAANDYGYGGKFLLVSGEALNCRMSLDVRAAPNCAGTSLVVLSPVVNPTSSWTPSIATVDVPAAAQSFAIFFGCSADAVFTVLVDDAFFGLELVPVELSGFSVE